MELTITYLPNLILPDLQAHTTQQFLWMLNGIAIAAILVQLSNGTSSGIKLDEMWKKSASFHC